MFMFDGNYSNGAQVREYLPTFTKLRDEMRNRGEYPYNDSFKGLIPGIAGDDEDTAIYLLQGLCHLEDERRRIDALRADGLEPIETLTKRTRFARVVIYREGHYVGGSGQIIDLEDARIEPDADGKPHAVLPKGKRTHGYRVNGAQVLARV